MWDERLRMQEKRKCRVVCSLCSGESDMEFLPRTGAGVSRADQSRRWTE